MIRYDPHLSLDLAEHAAVVYHLPHQFARWALERGYAGSTVIERGATQVGVAYSESRIVVACRGSSERLDWIENMLAFRVPWPRVLPVGSVHVGFRSQARRVAEELVDIVTALRRRYPRAEVYVTGHSLGGALALLCARLIHLRGILPAAIYTFESPRVGNREWGEWYDGAYGERTFRVVCIRRGVADIVTRIPPSAWGWWHTGQPIMLRDGVVYASEAEWEAARAAHPVAPLAQWRVISALALGVQAHLADRLVADLRAAV